MDTAVACCVATGHAWDLRFDAALAIWEWAFERMPGGDFRSSLAVAAGVARADAGGDRRDGFS